MYACDVKRKTVENQYSHIMNLISNYTEDENAIDAKISIDILTLCEETIELLLIEGYDIIKITIDDKLEKEIYQISWKNSFEGRKGEIKHININEDSSNFINMSNINLISNLFSSLFGHHIDEEQYDPVEDEEGFEYYY